jgi:YHS domain-containing protein
VVTGGAGTISVTHKGQTYYVCCTGCQQAFEDDPEGVLAEYAARLEKERLEREAAE